MEDEVIEELAVAYELTAAEAIAYFLAKEAIPTFNWFEMLDEEHDVAFTVAKMLDVDLIFAVVLQYHILVVYDFVVYVVLRLQR